jgi:hypothetical protein
MFKSSVRLSDIRTFSDPVNRTSNDCRFCHSESQDKPHIRLSRINVCQLTEQEPTRCNENFFPEICVSSIWNVRNQL